jgi:hypothetical protein
VLRVREPEDVVHRDDRGDLQVERQDVVRRVEEVDAFEVHEPPKGEERPRSVRLGAHHHLADPRAIAKPVRAARVLQQHEVDVRQQCRDFAHDVLHHGTDTARALAHVPGVDGDDGAARAAKPCNGSAGHDRRPHGRASVSGASPIARRRSVRAMSKS